jgi:hypothetical protein
MAEITSLSTSTRTALSLPGQHSQEGSGSSNADSVRSAEVTQAVRYASTDEGQATISALAEQLGAAFSDPNAGASAALRFQATAETYVIASMADDELEHALARVTNLWNRAVMLAKTLDRQARDAGGGAASPCTPSMLRAPGRAFSPSPSVASSAGSTHKRPRISSTAPATSPAAAATPGALTDDGLSAMGAALCDGLRARSASATDRHLSLEAECFSPILVEVNLTRRKVCSAIERS